MVDTDPGNGTEGAGIAAEAGTAAALRGNAARCCSAQESAVGNLLIYYHYYNARSLYIACKYPATKKLLQGVCYVQHSCRLHIIFYLYIHNSQIILE